MSISQAEATRLLSLPKRFETGVTLIELPRQLSFDLEYPLLSMDGHDRFLLDLERGLKKRIRLKYQMRAHKVCVLARLDMDGRSHRNPPDAPHRAGERLIGHHFHLYREGFGDRVAFYPDEVAGFAVPSDNSHISWLLAFLAFCHVGQTPIIQDGI